MVNGILPQLKATWSLAPAGFAQARNIAPTPLNSLSWTVAGAPAIPQAEDELDVYLEFVKQLHGLYPQASGLRASGKLLKNDGLKLRPLWQQWPCLDEPGLKSDREVEAGVAGVGVD